MPQTSKKARCQRPIGQIVKNGDLMETCKQCPKPSRCVARDKCFEGRQPAQSVVLAEPKPMRVLTTSGYGMTSEPKETKKRKVKTDAL